MNNFFISTTLIKKRMPEFFDSGILYVEFQSGRTKGIIIEQTDFDKIRRFFTEDKLINTEIGGLKKIVTANMGGADATIIEEVPLTVITKNWNGHNQNKFKEIAEKLLLHIVQKNIIISVPHNKVVKPLEDGDFNIFIWSSPVKTVKRTAPSHAFGIEITYKNDTFTPSGKGVPIIDDVKGYAVAEIVGNNLYIHHDICEYGYDREVKLFSKILKETIKLIKNDFKKETSLIEWYHKNSNTLKYSMCLDILKLVKTIDSKFNKIYLCTAPPPEKIKKLKKALIINLFDSGGIYLTDHLSLSLITEENVFYLEPSSNLTNDFKELNKILKEGFTEEFKKELQQKAITRSTDNLRNLCNNTHMKKLKKLEADYTSSHSYMEKYKKKYLSYNRVTIETKETINSFDGRLKNITEKDYLDLLAIGGIKNLTFTDIETKVHTKLICIEFEGKFYKIGEMLLTINFTNGVIKFKNLTRRGKASDDSGWNFIHPHVQTLTKEACFGNIGPNITQLISEYELSPLIQLLIQFLLTVNIKDPQNRGGQFQKAWKTLTHKQEKEYLDAST